METQEDKWKASFKVPTQDIQDGGGTHHALGDKAVKRIPYTF